MLVLARKEGERVRIGDDITVEVVEISGSKVRLGFAAGPTVKIYREELYDRMHAKKAEDGTHAPDATPAD